uniref:Leucine-rich repeat-containing N-terminal plant-type domain-containing protein n=1 Tax=Salix viminalis TaxID=40686 RepID=A0A6N2KDH9_SALVM
MQPLCSWDSGHVIGLDLSSSFLYIDSNSSLSHLVQLRRLNLAGNDFDNSKVPSGIRNLSGLFDLNLSMSRFSGHIPAEIFELSLDLGWNSLKIQKPYNPYLTGNLPEFQPGGQLEIFLLAGTSFSGQLGNLKSLKEFDVAGCHFSGVIRTIFTCFFRKITSTIVNILHLTYLLLQQFCRLTQTNSYGNIPSSFTNLTQLTVLMLNGNKLTGQIPSGIGNHDPLIALYLGENKLHGLIPESVYRLQNLEELA